MIHESSGIGKVEVSECLRTDVSSRVKKQKTSVGLGAKPPKADDKTTRTQLGVVIVQHNFFYNYISK